MPIWNLTSMIVVPALPVILILDGVLDVVEFEFIIRLCWNIFNIVL